MTTPGESEHRPTPPKGVPALGGELFELIKGYAKQETIDPLKPLGRFVGFGVLGSAILGTGLVFLVVGGLRVFQVETMLTGHLSWIPYLVVLAVAAILIGLYARAITKKNNKTRA